MSRETENALLLLVGVSTAIVAATGAYTRYVKPSLLPWLAASAALLIVLAVTAIVRDVRRGGHSHDDHGHGHRTGAAWLLVLPVALLAFIVPPPIGPLAAGPSVTEVSTDVLRRPFPPLPTEPAPEVSLPDVLIRVAQDSAGTLNGRSITVIGFTMRDGTRTDLARVVIMCCAADARLARIHVGGPAAARLADLPENTWVRVVGEVPPGQGDSSGRSIPMLNVSQVASIDPPKEQYAY